MLPYHFHPTRVSTHLRAITVLAQGPQRRRATRQTPVQAKLRTKGNQMGALTEHRQSTVMCGPTKWVVLVKTFWRKLSQTDESVNQQAMSWHSDWSIRRIPAAFCKQNWGWWTHVRGLSEWRCYPID